MGKESAEMVEFFRNVEEFARKKLDEHGLQDWAFGWDRARRRLGVCRTQKKQIT